MKVVNKSIVSIVVLLGLCMANLGFAMEDSAADVDTHSIGEQQRTVKNILELQANNLLSILRNGEQQLKKGRNENIETLRRLLNSFKATLRESFDEQMAINAISHLIKIVNGCLPNKFSILDHTAITRVQLEITKIPDPEEKSKAVDDLQSLMRSLQRNESDIKVLSVSMKTFGLTWLNTTYRSGKATVKSWHEKYYFGYIAGAVVMGGTWLILKKRRGTTSTGSIEGVTGWLSKSLPLTGNVISQALARVFAAGAEGTKKVVKAPAAAKDFSPATLLIPSIVDQALTVTPKTLAAITRYPFSLAITVPKIRIDEGLFRRAITQTSPGQRRVFFGGAAVAGVLAAVERIFLEELTQPAREAALRGCKNAAAAMVALPGKGLRKVDELLSGETGTPPPILSGDGGMSMSVATPDLMFGDISDMSRQKKMLAHIVEFLANPRRMIEEGHPAIMCLLFYGPPGTGKSLLAQALAGEASKRREDGEKIACLDVPCQGRAILSGGIVSIIRLAQQRASSTKGAIIILDELDSALRDEPALVPHLLQWLGSKTKRDDEGRLVADPEHPIIIIATSNKLALCPDEINNEAMLRELRFNPQIEFPASDAPERTDHLVQLNRKHALGLGEGEIALLARRTIGCTYLGLEKIIRSAKTTAGRESRPVTIADLDREINKTVLNIQPYTDCGRLTRRMSFYHGAQAIACLLLCPEKLDTITLCPLRPARHRGATFLRADDDGMELEDDGAITALLIVALTGSAAEIELCHGVNRGYHCYIKDLQRANGYTRQLVDDGSGVAGIDDEATTTAEARTCLQQHQTLARWLVGQQRPAIEFVARALRARKTIVSEELQAMLAREEEFSEQRIMQGLRAQLAELEPGEEETEVAAALREAKKELIKKIIRARKGKGKAKERSASPVGDWEGGDTTDEEDGE